VVHKLSYYTQLSFEIKTGETLLKQKTYNLHIFIIQKDIICQQQFVIIHIIKFIASIIGKLVACFVSNFSFQSSQAAEVYAV